MKPEIFELRRIALELELLALERQDKLVRDFWLRKRLDDFTRQLETPRKKIRD